MVLLFRPVSIKDKLIERKKHNQRTIFIFLWKLYKVKYCRYKIAEV